MEFLTTQIKPTGRNNQDISRTHNLRFSKINLNSLSVEFVKESQRGTNEFCRYIGCYAFNS